MYVLRFWSYPSGKKVIKVYTEQEKQERKAAEKKEIKNAIRYFVRVLAVFIIIIVIMYIISKTALNELLMRLIGQ